MSGNGLIVFEFDVMLAALPCLYNVVFIKDSFSASFLFFKAFSGIKKHGVLTVRLTVCAKTAVDKNIIPAIIVKYFFISPEYP